MAYSQTLLLNGLYDVMEYMIKDSVILKRKQIKYSDIEYVVDTLPIYYLQYLIQYYIHIKFKKRWNRFSKTNKDQIINVLRICNDKTHPRYKPHEFKCAPMDALNNFLFNAMNNYLNGKIFNKCDKKNIKKLECIYYRDMGGDLKRGTIQKTNGTYGNHISLLYVLPQKKYKINDTDPFLWKGDDYNHWDFERPCKMDIISIEQIVSNYEDENNRYIENRID